MEISGSALWSALKGALGNRSALGGAQGNWGCPGGAPMWSINRKSTLGSKALRFPRAPLRAFHRALSEISHFKAELKVTHLR